MRGGLWELRAGGIGKDMGILRQDIPAQQVSFGRELCYDRRKL